MNCCWQTSPKVTVVVASVGYKEQILCIKWVWLLFRGHQLLSRSPDEMCRDRGQPPRRNFFLGESLSYIIKNSSPKTHMCNVIILLYRFGLTLLSLLMFLKFREMSVNLVVEKQVSKPPHAKIQLLAISSSQGTPIQIKLTQQRRRTNHECQHQMWYEHLL